MQEPPWESGTEQTDKGSSLTEASFTYLKAQAWGMAKRDRIGRGRKCFASGKNVRVDARSNPMSSADI